MQNILTATPEAWALILEHSGAAHRIHIDLYTDDLDLTEDADEATSATFACFSCDATAVLEVDQP